MISKCWIRGAYMQYKKLIQEIIGTELEKYGFAPMPDTSWGYDRVVDNVWQSIVVLRERFCSGYIRMIFMTNAYGQKIKGLDDFVPGELPEYWHYETERELRSILEQFRDWTLAYGLDELKKMSIPTVEARPKPETNRYLYENHSELYEKYKKMLCENCTSWDEVIEAVQDRIKKMWELPFNEAEDVLIGLSALYAYALNEGKEGEWVWNEKANACTVDNVFDTFVSVYPLQDIISSWRNKNIKGLSDKREDILNTFEVWSNYKRKKKKSK